MKNNMSFIINGELVFTPWNSHDWCQADTGSIKLSIEMSQFQAGCSFVDLMQPMAKVLPVFGQIKGFSSSLSNVNTI